MFEQQSYDKATVATAPQPEGDLFGRYEIKNWEFSPLIYKILAASAVLHLAVLAFISQTNVLTMRGCDSPWVGRVCQVVDMTYLGAMLYGTDREYADVAYERTQLDPDDEIIYIIETAENRPLEYPEGYFQIANPLQYEMLRQQAAAGLNGTDLPGVVTPGMSIPNNDGDLLKIPANPPASNPNAFTDNSSSPLYRVGDGSSNAGTIRPRNARDRRNRPPSTNTDEKDPGETVANSNTNTAQAPQPAPSPNPDEATADKFGVLINKRPLKERATETLTKLEQSGLKLDKAFKVVIEGTLGLAKDGKTVVLKNPKPVAVDPNIPNDPEMVKLAQDWILAVGDSGWLGYLEKLELRKKPSSKKVVITVEQNDTEFLASIRSQVTTANEANTLATSLRTFITLGALGAKDDVLTFLKAATTGTEGSDVILNIKFEKPVVQQLIQRKLAESKEPKAEPSSTALISGTPNTASK